MKQGKMKLEHKVKEWAWFTVTVFNIQIFKWLVLLDYYGKWYFDTIRNEKHHKVLYKYTAWKFLSTSVKRL